MKVAALIQGLELVGRIYRNKDGSQPAEAVKKVLQQLQGASDMTLAEWAQAKQRPKAKPRKTATKAQSSDARIEAALKSFEEAKTQAAIGDLLGSLKLSAGEWQALQKKLTGKTAKSGRVARETIEMHFSDRLLLHERVEGVKRQFG
jgi:hypothetical protein